MDISCAAPAIIIYILDWRTGQRCLVGNSVVKKLLRGGTTGKLWMVEFILLIVCCRRKFVWLPWETQQKQVPAQEKCMVVFVTPRFGKMLVHDEIVG